MKAINVGDVSVDVMFHDDNQEPPFFSCVYGGVGLKAGSWFDLEKQVKRHHDRMGMTSVICYYNPVTPVQVMQPRLENRRVEGALPQFSDNEVLIDPRKVSLDNFIAYYEFGQRLTRTVIRTSAEIDSVNRVGKFILDNVLWEHKR